MGITLAQIRTQARHRADMTNSQFVTDAELLNYVNGSIAELHDLLIASGDSDYYILSTTFSTVSGTDTYALPSDFYKLRGVDVRDSASSDYSSLRPFNFNERNASTDGYNLLFRYRLAGSNLMLTPAPTGVYSIKLWYTPVATKLALDADVLLDVNQFAEYVIVDVAIKCLNKEESDVSVLMATKADLRKRIENMAQNRDAANPECIHDIYAENDYNFGSQ